MGWRWSLSASTYSVRSNGPYGSRMATREQHELKNSGSNLHSSDRRAREPGSIPIYWVMARVSSRPSYLDTVLIQKGNGKILMAQKLTDDKKGNSTGFRRGWPDPSPILDNDAPASQCFTRMRGRLKAWSRARWISCSSRCSSASSPGDRRVAVLAGSDPGDRSLWPTLPGSGSSQTAQAIPTCLSRWVLTRRGGRGWN